MGVVLHLTIVRQIQTPSIYWGVAVKYPRLTIQYLSLFFLSIFAHFNSCSEMKLIAQTS